MVLTMKWFEISKNCPCRKGENCVNGLNAARKTAFYVKELIKLKQGIHIYTGSRSSNTMTLSQNNLLPNLGVWEPRFKSSTYLSMRVEDPVNNRGGLKLGSALIFNQNLYFEIASYYFALKFFPARYAVSELL